MVGTRNGQANPPELGNAPRPPRIAQLSAVGEINEVRGLFQHCLTASEQPVQLDKIEVLVSDYARYAPLVVESMLQWLPHSNYPQDSNPRDNNSQDSDQQGPAFPLMSYR